MPREQRQAILAAVAEMAEEDYRSDKELTGFEAFSEEDLNDDESDSDSGRLAWRVVPDTCSNTLSGPGVD